MSGDTKLNQLVKPIAANGPSESWSWCGRTYKHQDRVSLNLHHQVLGELIRIHEDQPVQPFRGVLMELHMATLIFNGIPRDRILLVHHVATGASVGTWWSRKLRSFGMPLKDARRQCEVSIRTSRRLYRLILVVGAIRMSSPSTW